MTVKYYAYIPDRYGREPVGGSNKILFELKTDSGAIRRAKRILGPNARVIRYTQFYDETTYKQITKRG